MFLDRGKNGSTRPVQPTPWFAAGKCRPYRSGAGPKMTAAFNPVKANEFDIA